MRNIKEDTKKETMMADGLTELIEMLPLLRNERTNLLLTAYRETIFELRAQGKTYQMIAEILQQNGITVSTQTIRRYIKRNGA